MLDPFDLGNVLLAVFAGWRYLFSKSYRDRKRSEWRREGQMEAAADIAAGTAGVVATLLLPLAVWTAMS